MLITGQILFLDIRSSIEYFNKVANSLKSSGWKSFMEPDLSNCSFKERSWTMEEGVLTWHGGSYILDERSIW